MDLAVGGYGHGSDGRGGGWPGLRQVVNVRTIRERLNHPGDTVVEDHYYLTSLPPQRPKGRPDRLLRAVRDHWGIENHLHHVKDRTLGEDADRARQGASVLARLRSLTVGLLTHIPGASAPLKQIRAAAHLDVMVGLLRRKRLPRIKG